MRLSVRSLLVLSAVAVAACSTDSNLSQSQITAEHLNGTWSEPFTIPGESFVLHLTTHDTTVTGDGFFSFEAGPAGMLTVTGTVSGKQVDLDIVYSFGLHQHIRADLEFGTLSGYVYTTPVGDPAPITLKRTLLPPGAEPPV